MKATVLRRLAKRCGQREVDAIAQLGHVENEGQSGRRAAQVRMMRYQKGRNPFQIRLAAVVNDVGIEGDASGAVKNGCFAANEDETNFCSTNAGMISARSEIISLSCSLHQFSDASKFRDHLQGTVMLARALLKSKFQILAQQRSIHTGHISFHDWITICFGFHQHSNYQVHASA
ncbi:MAG: hypothetical protein ABIR24_06360 [Verrucomicrobiota bacterium]